MSKKLRDITPLPQGFKGSAGKFMVIHMGKNHYEVHHRTTGKSIGKRFEQQGQAHSEARRLHDLDQSGLLDTHGNLK